MNVTYSGFQVHNAVSDHIYRPSGLKHYLFVLTLSPMIFTFEDGHQETSEKGSCILFPPTVYQDYCGKEDFFNVIRQKSPILYRWVMNAIRYEGCRG